MSGRKNAPRKAVRRAILIACALFLAGGLAIFTHIHTQSPGGSAGAAGDMPDNPAAGEPSVPAELPPPEALPPAVEAAAPAEEMWPRTFVLSFAGDCTLGSDHSAYGSAGSFIQLVGDDYAYPLKNVAELFQNDDFTMVNLEGALTLHNVPAEKTFRFRGPPEYARILTAGDVQLVSLANNHTGDYGATGLRDTKAALEAEGVRYVENGKSTIYETERGLKIGVCAYFGPADTLKQNIEGLRADGAQIVIASFHFGDEGVYSPNQSQVSRARAAIDYGADIVFGHHPHVLQKIETYKNGVIYYSLGNFSFGGNRNPSDKDTAILRQTVLVAEDLSVSLGETEIIPCSISSESGRNTYQPTPYEVDSAGYLRVLSKLAGTYAAPARPSAPAEAAPADSAGEAPSAEEADEPNQPDAAAGSEAAGETAPDAPVSEADLHTVSEDGDAAIPSDA